MQTDRRELQMRGKWEIMEDKWSWVDAGEASARSSSNFNGYKTKDAEQNPEGHPSGSFTDL